MRLTCAGVWAWATLATVTPAFADEAAWQALMQQAGAARKADKPADAVEPLTAALKEAEAFPEKDPRLVITLAALADTDDALGRFAHSEALYARAIATIEKAAGPNHPAVGALLGRRAADLRKLGREAEADAEDARAAKIGAAAQPAGPEYGGMAATQWAQALLGPERIAAMQTLESRDSEALPVLVELLKSEHAAVRVVAATGLAGLGAEAESALPALIAAVKDKDLNVRYWALSSVKSMRASASSAVPALIAALSTHPSTEPGLEGPERYYADARSLAAEALGAIGPGAKAAAPRLEEVAAKDDSSEVRSAAAAALALIGK